MPEVRRAVTDRQHHHLLRFGVPLALKSAARTGRVEGLAAPFGPPPDRQGDVVRAGAFAKSLSEHASRGTRPAMLWQHKAEAPVGRWTDLREDPDGLVAAGQLNLDTEAGRKAFEHVAAGEATGLSIGYVVPEGGRKYLGDGAFQLGEADLVEISITPVPASPRARLTQLKSLQSRGELVDLLRDGGMSKAAAVLVATGGWPALTGDDRDRAEAAVRLAAAFDKSVKHLKGA